MIMKFHIPTNDYEIPTNDYEIIILGFGGGAFTYLFILFYLILFNFKIACTCIFCLHKQAQALRAFRLHKQAQA